ncbi:MAG TPA: glycosyltransferase family 4 protein [Vicinamibacterales bacterium]|nr:glycosyltransferase family 4 protein [Vicinamibacterales bacterium]
MPSARIVVVLQTPKDVHSAVLQCYLTLGAELTSRGHSLAIVTPDDFPVARRFGGRWTPFTYPVAVSRWLRANARQVDVVVSHSYACWLAASTSAIGRTPLVVAFHGLEPMYHHELRELYRRTGRALSWRYRFLQEQLMPRWLRAACVRASLVVCLNAAEREEILARGWTTPGGLAIFAHGVRDAYFLTRADRPVARLLFVGQWLPMKGVTYLRDAASDLLRRHPGLSLDCVGTLAAAGTVLADFPPDLRHRVNVRPRVDQSELPQIYADADLFLFPSLYEGFGRALLEAMAARLPIVSTTVGIAGEALSDGESCLVVPRHDAPAMVAAVDRLIGDEALRARLGATAHAIARTYRESDRIEEYADLLLAVAGRR